MITDTASQTGTAKTLGLIDGETVELMQYDDTFAPVTVRKGYRCWELVATNGRVTTARGAEKITIRR